MTEGLTTKQRVFVERYLANGFNATEAARHAGYKHPRQAGSETLSKPDIAAVIQARIAQAAMGADEVLARLADHARGSLSDFFTEHTREIEQGHATAIVRWLELDLLAAKQAGKLHLVKSYHRTAEGGVRVELYDAQAALQVIGKYHRLWTEKVEHSGAVLLKGYTDKDTNPDAWDADSTTDTAD